MKAVLWPCVHTYSHIWIVLIFLILQSARRNLVKVCHWEALDFSWMLSRLEKCLKGHFVILTLCLFFFPQTELSQKKLSQSCQGWSVHTSWSLTRSRAWILFTYFLLFRWKLLCGFLSSEHQIPVMVLALGPSGLDPGSNGCGRIWWQQNVVTFPDVVLKMSLVFHLP